MRAFQRLSIVLAALCGPTVAWAHPGHGLGDGTSLLHYLTSPIHVGGAMLALTVVIGIRAPLARLLRKP